MIALQCSQSQPALKVKANAPALRSVPESSRPSEACPATLVQTIAGLNAALATASDERKRLERILAETRAALGMAQAELFDLGAADEKFRHLAFHDTLTGLPNRVLFDDRFQHALAHAARTKSPLALMFIDLDRFKHINDIHGHEAGDRVLQVEASRLLQSVRAEDTVSRHGGDEFLCLLPGVPDRVGLERIAQKLVESLGAPIDVDGIRLHVTASIGIATSTGLRDAALLVRQADSAMYRAKRIRSTYRFFSA